MRVDDETVDARARACRASLPAALRDVDVETARRVAIAWCGVDDARASSALERVVARARTCARCGRTVHDERLVEHVERACDGGRARARMGGKRTRETGEDADARATGDARGDAAGGGERGRVNAVVREGCGVKPLVVVGGAREAVNARWKLMFGAMFRAAAFRSAARRAESS